jgi:hypothetical protein
MVFKTLPWFRFFICFSFFGVVAPGETMENSARLRENCLVVAAQDWIDG